MQQQTITMVATINTSASNNIDNNLQHSTGTTQIPIMKQESITNDQHHHHGHHDLNHNHHHQNHNHHQLQHQSHDLDQQQQQQFHQLQHQPNNTQQQPPQQQQQQPTQQNGPKPRGRRKKIRTEPIRPICPQCEKQFSNQSALTKHKLTHSDERRFACQQCSKAFKRHDHLTGHMQTHSNRKPFNCTIQGCDKTYCDARSLRRHKENIHHIVTQTQEPSHLLRRRIQRLHSDQGAYNRNVEHYQLNCVTAPPHSLPPQTNLTPQQVTTTTTTTTTPTPNGNSNSSSSNGSINHHQPASYLNHHSHVGLHGSYSADYASTQHFSFPMNDGNGSVGGGGHHHLNHHHHHHPALHHHQGAHLDHHAVTSLEHTLSTESLPHSADSITDSGLGLNVHYEQHTPQPQPSLPPPAPAPARVYHHQQQQQQQQQPPPPHHHQVSYSAGYKTTQHFDFDFDFVQVNGGGSGGAGVGHHHQHPAPHQSTHLGNHHATSLEHTLSTGSVPHSASSITDTGLDWNVHYGQHTPQPQQPSLPPPAPARLYHQQQQQQQQQQHHVSYSADYATTQHFNFDSDFVTSTSNHHHSHSNHHQRGQNDCCATRQT